VLGYAILFGPLIPRSTDSPQHLVAFVDDEPVIAQQMLGMTVKPYGNPANYLRAPWRVPAYWGSMRYPNFIYYGGGYLGLGCLLFAPLKFCLGLPDFPAAAICLRAVSFLSGMVALVAVYLLARRLGGQLAGAIAGLLLLTDHSFFYYCTVIHPDATMLALGLLALVAAIRHAEVGTLRSLAAVGLLAGMVHGTKMGGPWMVPVGLLALLWGLRPAGAGALPWRQAAGRLCLLGGAAAAGFVVSTPYAVLDSYYREMIQHNAAIYVTSPWEKANPWLWLVGLYEYLGPLLALLTVAALAAVAIRWFHGERRPAAVLTAVLALSVLLWYSTFIRLWVCIPYLLTALAAASVLVGALIVSAVTELWRRGIRGRGVCALAVLGCVAALVWYRVIPTSTFVLCEHLRERYVSSVVGQWAESHLPHDARLIFDEAIYIDPAVFPNSQFYGALMNYENLERIKPDYFVINGCLYNSAHYMQLRQTQKFTRGNEGPFSVLLYQDLLERGGVPEIELVKVFPPNLRTDHTRLTLMVSLVRGVLGMDDLTLGSEARLYRYLPAASK
jgi:hypothetical protein